MVAALMGNVLRRRACRSPSVKDFGIQFATIFVPWHDFFKGSAVPGDPLKRINGGAPFVSGSMTLWGNVKKGHGGHMSNVADPQY